MAGVIRVDRLSKDFPGCAGALSGVSLSVARQEAVAIVGPNGSGKSTLFKAVLGLVEPTAGHVELFGSTTSGRGRRGLARVGAVLEGRANIYQRLSTVENCAYYCGLRGVPFDRSHMRTLAGALGLERIDVPVRKLSTGNRQRAALLCAMVHRPELLMLDEPTLGLDRDGVQALRQLLRRQQEDGTTVVTISHDVGFVAGAADRVIGMLRGTVDFERAGASGRAASTRFRLELDSAQPLPPGICGAAHDAASFAEQLARLQELAKLYPDIRGASIFPLGEGEGPVKAAACVEELP